MAKQLEAAAQAAEPDLGVGRRRESELFAVTQHALEAVRKVAHHVGVTVGVTVKAHDVTLQVASNCRAIEAAAARAEADLAAWETENDAKAGEGNRLKVAKELHAQAISSDAAPTIVEHRGAWSAATDASIPSEVRELVEQLRSGGEQKEEAAVAMRRLARNADNQVAIARAGGIAPLVALARGVGVYDPTTSVFSLDGTDGQK